MRKALAVLILLLLLGCVEEEKISKDLSGRRILMIVAPQNFRDEELFVPKRMFEDAGAKVIISSKGVNEAVGIGGARVKVDVDLSEVDVQEYDAIVFVGGVGALSYVGDPVVRKIVLEANSTGKIVAAICVAPAILAEAGILNGKNATVWPQWEYMLREHGANYVHRSIVRDGNIITAFGPTAAEEFAEEIAESI